MSQDRAQTIKLYDNDSHQKEFTARVLSCIPSGTFFKVELSETLFFPEGGGQPADTGIMRFTENGSLTETFVSDVKIEGVKLFHFTDKAVPEGAKINGIIDWEKRFSRMQNHSGEHVVSGIIHSMFGYENIGFHLTDEYATCDYNGTLTKKDILEIERRANEAVFSNLKITCEYPSPEILNDLNYRSKLELTEDVRIVTIDGIDVCACCAPHVNTTGEIGLIKIVNHEKSHGGTRLHLRCGRLALSDYNEKQDNILRIIDMLSARQFETADLVQKLINTNQELNHEISKKSAQIAECRLSLLEDKVYGNLVIFLPDADTDTLRILADKGRTKCTGIFIALTNQGNSYRYMITSSGLELSKLVKEYNVALNGRGGGKDEMVQGTFGASLEDIKKYFSK